MVRVAKLVLWPGLFAAFAAVLGCSQVSEEPSLPSAQAAQASGPERIELEGGPVVIFLPVEDTGRVAVQAMYDVGIIDEPAGIAQASHLIEHLACFAATDQGAAGETFRKLNEIGMTNAETLPNLTHYDYAVPADQLDFAIRTEAERLRSLKIDEAIVAQEAMRCYEEVRMVASRTPSALGKFALMAATQSWRYSRNSANVLGGLETSSLKDLQAFHARFHNKRNLTLVVAGSVARDAVIASVEKHFGDLPDLPLDHKPIAWSELPKRSEIAWDANATIVYLAFPPPEDRAEQLLLTAVFEYLPQTILSDSGLSEFVIGMASSNRIWPVGRCPGFVAATLKAGADRDAARTALVEKLNAAIARLTPEAFTVALSGIANVPFSMDSASMKASAASLAKQLGSTTMAYDSVLGNTAIQIGVREIWLGPDRQPLLDRALELAGDEFESFVRRTLPPEKMIVTTLVPQPR